MILAVGYRIWGMRAAQICSPAWFRYRGCIRGSELVKLAARLSHLQILIGFYQGRAMRPRFSVVSDDDIFIKSLVACICDIDCSEYFSTHLGKPQSEQKLLVSNFQSVVCSKLKISIENVEWSTEYSPHTKSRDSIDIYGKGDGFVVVIELDKARADQVAKKFVSRIAFFPFEKVYFISLCYPGTKNMSQPECEKFFAYCSALALRTGNHYAGLIVH